MPAAGEPGNPVDLRSRRSLVGRGCPLPDSRGEGVLLPAHAPRVDLTLDDLVDRLAADRPRSRELLPARVASKITVRAVFGDSLDVTLHQPAAMMAAPACGHLKPGQE